ncbi:MAG: hypothetical protein RJA70_671 [Pseudomonadota bacterium]
MRRLLSGVCRAAVFALGVSACAPPAPFRAARPSLLSGLVTSAGYQSPARWQYHPPQAPRLVRAYVLSANETLYLADGGERWISSASPPFTRVAQQLAPERLVAALDLNAEGWVFIGETGVSYEAQEPLGSFLRSSAPPEPLVRVTATPNALVGVSRTGRVMRSVDHGGSWLPVVTQARASDVALTTHGDGLLLTVPERLLSTRDHGASWTQLALPRFGAVQLEAVSDEVQVHSLLESRVFSPRQSSAWRTGHLNTPVLQLRAAVPQHPSAMPLVGNQAVTIFDKYFAVERLQDVWHWKSGRLSEELTTRPLPIARPCHQLTLSGFGSRFFLACFTESGELAPLRLFASVDSGTRWSELRGELFGKPRELEMAVLEEGSLVVSGICPPHKSEPGCLPAGVHVRRSGPSESQVERWQTARVPGLLGLPKLLLASHEGSTVLLLGSRSKSDALVAFISPDAMNFVPRELKAVTAVKSQFRSTQELLSVHTAGAGEDGFFSVTLRQQGSSEYSNLVLDSAGEFVSLSRPPEPSASIAGSGLFALAHSPSSRETWESVDGGVSWTSIGRAPAAGCGLRANTRSQVGDPASSSCSGELACHALGCVVGSALSRLGWRGQVDQAGAVMPVNFGGLPAEPARVRTPINCRFVPDRSWQSLSANRIPGASQAMIGEAAWFAFAANWDDASVTLFEATLASEPSVARIPLFPPTNHPEQASLNASLQIEGVAALRQVGGSWQVAWKNWIDGGPAQTASLPPGFSAPESPTRAQGRLAEPDLLSIAPSGVFVRGRASGATLFTSGGTWSTLPPSGGLPGGLVKAERVQAEMARVDNQSIAIHLVGSGAGIVRSRYVEGSWVHDAASVGLLSPSLFALRQHFDIAYSGKRAGYHLVHQDALGAQGWLFPFSAGPDVFPEAIPVPNQSDLTEAPRACSNAERTSTPRVIVPAEAPTRHPVVVTDSSEPIGVLLTGDAVLFGTPEQPCVAAFDASALTRSSSDQQQALVVVDEDQPSWLFRQNPQVEGLEYRVMRCRIDPHLEVPAEVYSALGVP